jgi:hypothetical protein
MRGEIAESGEAVNICFIDIAQNAQSARHVSIKSAVPHSELGFISSRENKPAFII